MSSKLMCLADSMTMELFLDASGEKKKEGMSTAKKVALGLAGAGAAVGGALLGRRLLRGRAAKATKATNKATENASQKPASPAKQPSAPNSPKPSGNPVNTHTQEDIRKTLSDPNGRLVFGA